MFAGAAAALVICVCSQSSSHAIAMHPCADAAAALGPVRWNPSESTVRPCKKKKTVYNEEPAYFYQGSELVIGSGNIMELQ